MNKEFVLHMACERRELRCLRHYTLQRAQVPAIHSEWVMPL
jgi:hypothetical protein